MMINRLLNVLSYTREIVITCTFFAILYLRSIHAVYFTASAILTTLIAKILKRIIKQPRPVATTKKTSYGMPSSHSTAISFFSTYLQSLALSAVHHTAEEDNRTLKMTIVVMAIVAFYCFSIAVIWSRVQLGHHTRTQVVAGALLGAACALLAHTSWTSFISRIVI
ncbi:MAG: phosphatidic acid phosphatase type 2/haloperoxidase [Benjaminiella poitrasii]|nr:MAG: phosphatidic acid phosphatase type 2/haloperoxidase [Benjaminiella poitrasii]